MTLPPTATAAAFEKIAHMLPCTAAVLRRTLAQFYAPEFCDEHLAELQRRRILAPPVFGILSRGSKAPKSSHAPAPAAATSQISSAPEASTRAIAAKCSAADQRAEFFAFLCRHEEGAMRAAILNPQDVVFKATVGNKKQRLEWLSQLEEMKKIRFRPAKDGQHQFVVIDSSPPPPEDPAAIFDFVAGKCLPATAHVGVLKRTVLDVLANCFSRTASEPVFASLLRGSFIVSSGALVVKRGPASWHPCMRAHNGKCPHVADREGGCVFAAMPRECCLDYLRSIGKCRVSSCEHGLRHPSLSELIEAVRPLIGDAGGGEMQLSQKLRFLFGDAHPDVCFACFEKGEICSRKSPLFFHPTVSDFMKALAQARKVASPLPPQTPPASSKIVSSAAPTPALPPPSLPPPLTAADAQQLLAELSDTLQLVVAQDKTIADAKAMLASERQKFAAQQELWQTERKQLTEAHAQLEAQLAVERKERDCDRKKHDADQQQLVTALRVSDSMRQQLHASLEEALRERQKLEKQKEELHARLQRQMSELTASDAVLRDAESAERRALNRQLKSEQQVRDAAQRSHRELEARLASECQKFAAATQQWDAEREQHKQQREAADRKHLAATAAHAHQSAVVRAKFDAELAKLRQCESYAAALQPTLQTVHSALHNSEAALQQLRAELHQSQRERQQLEERRARGAQRVSSVYGSLEQLLAEKHEETDCLMDEISCDESTCADIAKLKRAQAHEATLQHAVDQLRMEKEDPDGESITYEIP